MTFFASVAAVLRALVGRRRVEGPRELVAHHQSRAIRRLEREGIDALLSDSHGQTIA